ncbi:MAG: N-formylglutamate amidohydrolase [Cyclobacteriaceae bacterium]
MKKRQLILTCEHAGNQVPEAYQYLFENKEKLLKSHRGWDPGAVQVADFLHHELQCPLFKNYTTRLLVECNRSVGNEALFSEISNVLKPSIKKYLLEKFYYSYRNQVAQTIAEAIKTGPILHVSVHTFTPIFNGIERKLDVGILYDDARQNEVQFCEKWRDHFEQSLQHRTVALNLPYNGADDGFTTYLRTLYDDTQYLGIEIEINQKYARRPEMEEIQSAMKDFLKTVIV